MKKYLSFILVLVMVLSLCTVTWGEEKAVANAAELINAITSVQDGDVIKLTNDVTFTTTDRSLHGTSYYDGIYYLGDKSFTIDLGGKTITAETGALNNYLLCFINKGSVANTITIKNGTLTAPSDVYSAVALGGNSGTALVTLNTENLAVNGSNPGGNVMLVRAHSGWNANTGTVVTSDGGYAALESSVGTSNINTGAKLIQKNSSGSSLGGAFGASNGGVVNLNGGEVVSDLYGVYAFPTGGTANIKSGTVTAPTALFGDTENTGATSTINVSGGTITGEVVQESGSDAAIVVSGGTFTDDNVSNYVDDGTAAAKVNNSYVVGADAIVAAATTGAKVTVVKGSVTLSNGTTLNVGDSEYTVPQPPVYYPIYTPVEDTKVDSAQTFDAGIALYVGVSIMGAVGAVALGKKRED